MHLSKQDNDRIIITVYELTGTETEGFFAFDTVEVTKYALTSTDFLGRNGSSLTS